MVPDPVMHELVVPLALPRLDIEREQRFREQRRLGRAFFIAAAMATVIVAGRQLDGHVDDAELFVGAHLRPDAGVTGVGRRIRIPRVVAGFALHRDGVENPDALAGTDIEAANEALDVGLALRCAAFAMRGANHDHVLGDDRRGMQADLRGREVEAFLIEAGLQVDDAVGAEVLHRQAGLGVERNHLVARRDVDDALVLAVGPVREAAARQLARRGFTALAFLDAVHPLPLARGGVETDHGAARAGGGEQPAVDHQRRGLVLELGARTEVVGLEPEGQLQLAEVGGVDLLEWGVARRGEVPAIGRPFARLGCHLSPWRHAREANHRDQGAGTHEQTA